MPGVIAYQWVPCTSDHYRRYAGTREISHIILHSTDGHEGGDIETLSGKTKRIVSVHWYVTRHGAVYHFVQDNDIAFHAGKVLRPCYANERTIGIEQEHMDGYDDWPELQVRTVARLCAALCQKHGLTISEIVSHADVAAPKGRKQDPLDFPWMDFGTYAREAMAHTWVFQKAG